MNWNLAFYCFLIYKYFESASVCVAQTSLKLKISCLSLLLGLQVYATMAGFLFLPFLKASGHIELGPFLLTSS
jgi:hypothetical protein